MSNTTCRPHGIAKRALALLTAIALATALTPSFALAEEANNSASITAEQNPTADSASSPSTADSAANKADATQDVSESQASGSSSAAGHATTSSSKANAGESADTSSANKAPSQSANAAEPANQASSTKADTVSATLKISVYGTTLVSHTFSIEKGKTVEDMLNLAVEQGYINSYSHGTPYPGYTAYYVNSIAVNGIAYTQPANYSEYWSSTINGAWESDGINGNKIESDGFSYELSYVSNDPNTKYDNGTGTYPTSPNAPHPDKATGSDTTSYVKSEGNTSAATSAPTSSSNAALAWKKNYGNNNYSEILTLGDSIYFASSLLNPDWTAQPAVLHRLNAKTGEETASLQLFSAIDSTCRPVYTDGSLSESNAALFASKSTSTATFFQGNLFVGGGAADYTGTLSVVDAATMQIKHSVSLPFEVKSAPLVAKAADGNTYAYFTCNGAEGTWPNYTSGGGAWVYCLETNTATKLFDATGSMANWCTKSIVMGADGTLYWTNDSGTLFALANAASSSNGNDSDSTQTPENPGTNNQQGNKAPGSNASEHAPAATPISAGNASAAAQAPLSDAEALAENEASNEGSAVTSASSARGTSSNNSNDSKGAPWLPIAGIVAGCVGLVAVGAFLFRRRSL